MHYPVMICRDTNVEVSNYIFSLPDMPGCVTKASSIENGLQKLTSVIENHLEILVEYGEEIPAASGIENQLADHHQLPDNFLSWLLIEVDILPYLGKSHKINVTLPELLIKRIDNKVNVSASYKTRSHFIAEACLAELKRNE